MLSLPIVLLQTRGRRCPGGAGACARRGDRGHRRRPARHFRSMDYVEPGQVIKLGPHDTLVIGYLKSCWHETITGGTVTVGAAESDVQGGQVERSQTTCDGGKMLLTSQLADASAGAAFRAPPPKNPEGAGTAGVHALWAFAGRRGQAERHTAHRTRRPAGRASRNSARRQPG